MPNDALQNLRNRIDLTTVPFTDRGSRIMLFRRDQHLFVRLAERWTKWEHEVGHYRLRPSIIERLSFLGPDGEPLAFESETFPHLARINTDVGSFEWVFVEPEALLTRLPAGTFGLEFEVYTAADGRTDRRGGTLRARRNVAYTTDAAILENTISSTGNGTLRVRLRLRATGENSLMLNITPRLGFNRTLIPPASALDSARARWQAWFDATPPVLDEYQAQYDYAWWIMRAGLLNQRFYFTREALVPSKIHYVGVWHWDQFFHALAYRHLDTTLAENQIRIIIDHQREDGMFPDAVHDEGLVTRLEKPVSADVTKPPLMAWTVLKIFEKSGNRDFLQETYEPMTRWHTWWMRENRDGSGLCYYQHPFSSGLDDSPLWDAGMPVIAPDLNTYLYQQASSLSRIAELIGEHDDAAMFAGRADDLLQAMLKHQWDADRGCFQALYNGKPVPVFTPFHLLPLWTGALPQAINARLVAHLTDPETFWPQWPLPTVAINDPKFDPLQMWRGPVWTNINYLFVDGLERIGQTEVAGRLRRKTLELMMQHNDIYEYYHPLTGERPPKAAPIFGWSAATFIDLALQETAAHQQNGG